MSCCYPLCEYCITKCGKYRRKNLNRKIYTIRINPMYYIIAKRTPNGDVPLLIKETFQEVIDAIKELMCPPYVYEQIVIYDCDKSPIKARYIDGKIMID